MRPNTTGHAPARPDPPSIWLDAEPGQLVKWAPDGKLARLSAEPAGQLSLRCHVAANPIAHNAILQIDWLKDGRPLAPGAAGRQNQATRIKIEKSNHLHMPVVAGGEPGHQQRPPAAGPAPGWPAAGRLMAASSLAISRLVRADSGAYSCQYKLIPAPGAGQSAGAQLAGRLGSAGQAGQSIQVNVAEGKCGAGQPRAGEIWAELGAPAAPRAQRARELSLERVTGRRATSGRRARHECARATCSWRRFKLEPGARAPVSWVNICSRPQLGAARVAVGPPLGRARADSLAGAAPLPAPREPPPTQAGLQC